MDLWGLCTSAFINVALSIVLLYVYSVVRKLPSHERVYFRGRPPHWRSNAHSFVKLVPKWIQEAWQASDEDILHAGGLDAVVFLRMITFSIRIFCIAAPICISLLRVNYFGKQMLRQHIPALSLDVFTIENVREGSKWLWLHCLVLYIISCSACVLLLFENKNITKMRLEHIAGSSLNASFFTIVVRAIPSSSEESYGDSLRKLFTSYGSGYLSHQMVYQSVPVQKLKNDASKMIKSTSTEQFRTDLKNYGLCIGAANSFEVLSSESESVRSRNNVADPNLRDKECEAALVFFESRYAALVASQGLQSENPMSWVTDLAPEPHDVYWKNLSIPYGHLWVRRIAILLASFCFVILFMVVVTFVQGLLLLEHLEKRFPFLSEVLKNKYMVVLITGYLPSVVLMLFLWAVPPIMMMFSTFEGPVAHSGREKSACHKVLYFFIWNVFFVNLLSVNILQQLGLLSNPRHMTLQVAAAVPRQATFFMTYILTSGWLSLAFEIMQPYGLVCNLFCKYVLRKKDEPSDDNLSFPYHTEIPKVLLFGFLGFNYSLMAPLILPFLVIFFFLASLVYRNQILNVYVTRYQSGGQFWPMMHNSTIFSLVLAQVISIGVFGLKKSPVAAGCTVPLIIFTLFFNEYCRRRFHPVFKHTAAQVLRNMDERDEKSGRMKVIHQQLPKTYCQFASTSNNLRKSVSLNPSNDADDVSIRIREGSNPGVVHVMLAKAHSI